MKPLNALALSAAALVIAGTAATPAAAGPIYAGPAFAGGFYGPGFHPGFYGPRHRFVGGRRGAFRRGFYRGRRGRGLSGAEAALIATGIIGGVILIDQALENNNRRAPVAAPYRGRPYYGDRGDWRTTDAERRALNAERRALDAERRLLDAERRALEAERRIGGEGFIEPDPRFGDAPFDDSGFEEDGRFDEQPRYDAPRGSNPPPVDADPLDDRLLGAADRTRIQTAYRLCAAETRAASDAGRLLAALPEGPGAVDRLAGGAYRLTTSFSVSSADGDMYRRVMTCDADPRGVQYLAIG
ncbi:MAG: hypothetical protein AAGC56_12850 [Pseudomonadota bacterium]